MTATIPRPAASTAVAEPAPGLRPLSWVVLRAPALPIEDYLRITTGTPADRHRYLDDPAVRTSIAVGSPDLADAMRRGPDTLDPKDRRRFDSSLLRYLTRMSSRPTPYGMFAGVALVGWGETTTAALADRLQTHSRPDMTWMGELLASVAADPTVLPRLRLSRHRCVVVRGERAWLSDRTSKASVRATPAVLAALQLADCAVPHADLVAALSRRPGATPEKAAALVDELLRNGLLVTELRPSLLSVDPAADAVLALRRAEPDGRTADGLQGLRGALAAFDTAAPADAPGAFADATARARALHGGRSPIQVDATWTVTGALATRVGEATARAAQTMLALSPAPTARSALTTYRHAFEARFGRLARIPLLDVVDPVTGLGLPGHGGREAHDVSDTALPQRLARRNRRLQDLALRALRRHDLVVELTDADISELRLADPSDVVPPVSVDVSVFVLATDAADVDAGRFQLAIGPNLGASAAGRNLGRFAAAFGKPGLAALEEVAANEAALAPDRVLAEVVYEPTRPRAANVAVRPPSRTHRIVTRRDPDVDEDVTIPLDELVVGLDGDRLRLTWGRDGVEVVPCATHMLTTAGAPPAVALLEDLARGAEDQLALFDWGPAGSLPVLPRVVHRGVVLRPAQWTLDLAALGLSGDPAPDAFAVRCEDWRREWDVPRRVYLTVADNRLLLDLDETSGVAELRRELSRLGRGGVLVLQEAVPGPEHAWLPGPRGRYLCELMVPLVRSAAPAAPAVPPRGHAQWRPQAAAPRPTAVASPAPAAVTATKLPGSEWLYAKVYLPPDREDELLTGPVRELCELAVLGGAARDWFFLRYADPASHLRLRFRGDPDQLTDLLVPRLFTWAAELQLAGTVTGLAVDTYEREVERYGGPAAIALAEEVFCADSAAVLELLEAIRTSDGQLDPLTCVCAGVDGLLDALGYDVRQRLAWYQAQVRDRRASGAEYRTRSVTLRALLTGARTLGDRPSAALAERHARLEGVGERLAEIEARAALVTPSSSILASHVHMHLNRLLGRRTAEDLVLGLLLRTWHGLGVNAP